MIAIITLPVLRDNYYNTDPRDFQFIIRGIS